MSYLLPCRLLLLLLLLLTAAATDAAATQQGGVLAAMMTMHSCDGSIGQCNEEETEWLMDSPTTRRLLQGPNGIVYHAINSKSQAIPARSGAPYGRGCNGSYRCRNGVSY